MVLYIFHVNTGAMLTFEMEMALQTVQNLKETIERLHGIPAVNQVLLISGGEVLQPSSRVCSYSSGTDENPIYMFSTLFDSSKHLPPWPSIESHIHYEEEVNRCLTMPAEYNTVVVRAKLAQKMFESATKEIKICERLVFEQHLQQQGWAAVMANLEDLTNEFKQRSSDFLNTINEYIDQRPNYIAYLESFHEDLTQLSTVPILFELLPSAQSDFHGFDDYYQDNVSFTGSTSGGSGTSGNSGKDTKGTLGSSQRQSSVSSAGAVTNNNENNTELELNEQQQVRSLTLLQWISTKENHKSLQDMAEDCNRVLTHFDEAAINYIRGAIKHALDNAEQENVREVRGLTQRLEQLDELMCSAKKTVQEQKELSTAFQQNQTRASNLGDDSILPDLCMSHSNHLTVMLTNHNKLLDIEKRIMKAKEELGDNLIKRLRYVVHIQSSISDLDCKLLFHHRCFRRLKHHIVIIEQIHHAPNMYMKAVSEVVRRKTFSNAFLTWASDLANHLLTIYSEEVVRRQDFNSIFENHFLNILFTGLEDMPPAFATQAPPAFDNNLPIITKNDLELLKTSNPDIASKLEMTDLKDILEFFAKCTICAKEDSKIEELKLNAIKPLDLHAHLKDCFESETDTEEFEKVGQSPTERQKSLGTQIFEKNVSAGTMTSLTEFPGKPESSSVSTSTNVIETQSTETLTEDNLGTTRLEVERLRALIKSMSQLSNNSISLLREQLRSIKEDSRCDKEQFAAEFKKLEEAWTNLKQQNEINERELINRLTVDHELELNDIRKSLIAKDDEIAALKCDNNKLIERLANSELSKAENQKATSNEVEVLKFRISALEKQVEEFEIDKEKAVNAIKEKLICEHKTEIESLRCRFKLIKTMERSPSDTSLEKIDRPELIDYDRSGGTGSRSTLLASSPKSPTSGQSLFKRILDEKERQLDVCNAQLQTLLQENGKLKNAIQSLTDDDQNESFAKLKEEVEALQKDKLKLKQKLNMERSKRMETSTSDKSSSTDASSTALTRSSSRSTKTCSKKSICIESCESGDTVLVVWNDTLCRYIIAQESQYLHFLAEDSHPSFNLPVPSTRDIIFENIQKPPFFLGIVTEKQYCMVKKEGTRYRVPIGTKFCRIKVRPLSPSRRISTTSDGKSSSRANRQERNDSDPNRLSTNVSHSYSIQLIDSFAQTDVVNTSDETKLISSLVDKDMVDSGVVAQARQGDRISIAEDDEGAVSISYEDRCVIVSEEDEAVVVDNRSSQEEPAANAFEFTSEILLERDQDDSDEYRSLDARDEEMFS